MIKALKLLTLACILSATAFAQKAVKKTTPNGWHLEDLATTGYNGISIEKAYAFLRSTNRKSNQIIVAVIDSGIDTLHEDLKPILWRNPKEIPGNNKDDDKNGFIDDVNGWNFIGGKDGRNVKEDSYEAARVYHKLKAKWEGKTGENLTGKEKKEFDDYTRAKAKTVEGVNTAEIEQLKMMLPKFKAGDEVIRRDLGKTTYDGNALKTYSSANNDAMFVKQMVMGISQANNSYEITNEQLLEQLDGEIRKAEAADTPPENFRDNIVQDDPTNINDRYYGNNDIMANTPFHGTHCAGIIAAVRNNNKGVNGVADNVRIMMIRAVPDGDEHDKDIANAIRYAVDNGARVISMSFGKDFSPQKMWVDDAFKYAAAKGVLLVHAAGNDAKDIDVEENFPSTVFEDGTRATNVITVGAAGDEKNGGLTASFSNYGKKEVDVFAPGVAIYSTIPGGDTYGNSSGTSMAGPAVAGIAALLLQYYPTLTPTQLKMAIEKSAQKPKYMVTNPGTKQTVDLSELSVSGGMVNAYEAAKYASTIGEVKQQPKKKLPKTTIKKTRRG